MTGRQKTSVPSVYRLPSGLYQATFRADGRQRSRSFPTLREARTFLAQTKADMARGAYIDPAGGRITFGVWVGMWLETRKVRASTAARTQWALQHYLLPRFRDRPLGAINRREVQTWVRELEAIGLSKGSVERCYTLLAQIMREATEEDLIVKSPCRGIKFDQDAPEARKPRVLSTDEAATLLDVLAPKPWAHTLVLFLLGTGTRFGEATGLRRSRVELLRRPPAVSIAEALHEVNGVLAFGPPKSKASLRTIPLASPVAEALAVHLPLNGEPDDLVFTSPRGQPLRRTNFASSVWVPARKAAGLEDLRVHDLRHSCASWLADGGVPEVVVASVLGHRGGSTITAHYTTMLPGSEAKILEVLDERLQVALGRDERRRLRERR